VKNKDGSFRFELVDGQQRVTSILDFLNGVFSLPEDFIIDGVDLSSMNCEKLKTEYSVFFHRILQYKMSVVWYENLTDENTSYLFIEVLNKNMDMKAQEIRNAVLGSYTDYVRDTARPAVGMDQHELFEVYISKPGSKREKTLLNLFGNGFALKGRMERDEWLSELIFLKLHGVRHGVNQTEHTNWVKKVQAAQGKYSERFTDKKIIDELLNLSLDIMKAANSQGYKQRLNSMTSMMLILFADELITKYGKIKIDKYVEKFFEVYFRWNKAETIVGKKTANGGVLREFSKLFGGKNSNAIKTIFLILKEELDKNKDDFGIIELDPRETFSESQRHEKWIKQGKKDYYTGLPLKWEDTAGDHYIPRSWGIVAGGVTELENLAVASIANNRRKLNMHGDDFLKLMESEK
jgi:hypothetical protein